jgi:hypothetical protein
MQSEDHEFARMMARVAAHEAFDAAAARERVTVGEAINAVSDAAIDAYLSRVSPSRDGTVAVEDVERLVTAARAYFREFDHLVGDVDYPERRDLREALTEFGSARAGESNQNDERRH